MKNSIKAIISSIVLATFISKEENSMLNTINTHEEADFKDTRGFNSAFPCYIILVEIIFH